jgi:hypothetical protein
MADTIFEKYRNRSSNREKKAEEKREIKPLKMKAKGIAQQEESKAGMAKKEVENKDLFCKKTVHFLLLLFAKGKSAKVGVVFFFIIIVDHLFPFACLLCCHH